MKKKLGILTLALLLSVNFFGARAGVDSPGPLKSARAGVDSPGPLK